MIRAEPPLTLDTISASGISSLGSLDTNKWFSARFMLILDSVEELVRLESQDPDGQWFEVASFDPGGTPTTRNISTSVLAPFGSAFRLRKNTAPGTVTVKVWPLLTKDIGKVQ